MAAAGNIITRWIFGEENPPLQNRAARRQQQRESRRPRYPSLTPSTQSQSQAPEPINTLTQLIFGNRPTVLEFNDYRVDRKLIRLTILFQLCHKLSNLMHGLANLK